MDFIQKLWDFLSGKKTAIGATLLFVSAFLEQVVIGQWGSQAAWIPQLIGTLDWFGMVLTGIGLSHKGVKVIKPKNE